MFKKIYSLLASALILTACTVDESLIDPQPVDNGSGVAVAFALDAPVQETATKSSAVPIEGTDPQPWVKNLVLYTFDENDVLTEAVAAKPVSAGSNQYAAIVKKTTRKIHFVSNYGDAETVTIIPGLTTGTTTEAEFESLRTQEYIYWTKTAFNPANATLGTITLLRNWSRLSLTNTSEGTAEGITDVKYLVYSTSKYATFTAKDGSEINLPASNEWNRPAAEPAAAAWTVVGSGESFSYMFENDNYKDNATFVIVYGKFLGDNEYYYYKVDISNAKDGITTLYNIVRNKWYQVAISQVLQKGVTTWAEVIDPDKIPDNNVMAAAQISDYPKVAYQGYTLEVFPKTTYIFTNPTGNQLNFNIEYRNSGTLINNSSDLRLYFPSDISAVVNGNITLNNGVISAAINNVTPGSIKETEFYIIAGDLQRRIKLILRPAYEFLNFSVTPNNPSAVDANVTVHFELPLDIDKSVFPLEVAIRSNQLYSVESGVRIDTYSNGDYAYIYTIQEQDFGDGKFNVKFKTNAANAKGYVVLNAKNFDEKSGALGTPGANVFREALTSRSGNTLSLKFTTLVLPAPYEVNIAKPGDLAGAGSYTVTRAGDHTVAYTTATATGTGTITLSAAGYTNEVITFTYPELIRETPNNSSRIRYGTGSGTNIPTSGLVVTSVTGVTITMTSAGYCTLTIPAGTRMNQPISIYYRYSAGSRYKKDFASVTDLYNAINGGSIILLTAQ